MPDITQVLNLYVIHIEFLQKCFISAKIEPHKFSTTLPNLPFSRPFQLFKINSTESYVFFFLARTYRARTQLIFNQYERHSIFSVRKALCLALQGPNFDPRDEIYKYTKIH